MGSISAILFTLLIYSAPSAAGTFITDEDCLIEPLRKLAQDGRIRIDERFKDTPGSIYLGVSNHPKEGDHHYYLVARNRRYDGLPFFFRPKLRVGTQDKPVLLSKGVIFQIEAGTELASEISKIMLDDAGRRHLTCAHGACEILEQAGIGIPSRRAPGKPRSGQVLGQSLLNKQVIGPDGKPLPVRVVATSPDEMKHFVEQLPNIDASIRSEVGIQVLQGGLIVVFTGGATYLILAIHEGVKASRPPEPNDPR